jgi:hypothetical protein
MSELAIKVEHAPLDPNEEMFDVVNLTAAESGVVGTLFVSTMQGAHGPRVKWFPERASRDGACLIVTLEDTPRVINQGLPAIEARRAERAVLSWVALNRTALLSFWNDGVTWTRTEVNAFFDGLQKLP